MAGSAGGGDSSHRSLTDIRKGRECRIVSLPNDPIRRSQCIRLGIHEGEVIACLERLPGATMVVQIRRQEIALGRDLASDIVVEMHVGENR